jgi:PAS domain S-box-containing protein
MARIHLHQFKTPSAEGSVTSWADSVLEAAFDAIITVESDGLIVECNRQAERLFGYSHGDLIGHSLADLIAPSDDRDASLSAQERFARAAEPTKLDRRRELRAVHQGGGEFPVEFMLVRAGTSQGHLVAFVRDMTTARAAEQSSLGMERLLARAERLARMGSWSLNLQTGEALWSDELFRLQGFDPGSVEPSIELLLRIVHAEDRDRIEALLTTVVEDAEQILEREQHFGYRTVGSDGSIREMEARGRVEADGRGAPALWVGSTRDVTDQRISERELQAHYAIGQALSDWESFEEGVVMLLRRVGTALGFGVGSLWTRNADSGRLTCRAFWSAPGVDPAEFERTTRATEFCSGDGVPGRAWKSEHPVFTDDIREDVTARCGELADALGLRSGIAFPASGPDGTLAVLSFYSFERLAPSDHLTRTLVAIGRELGRFLASRRVELGPLPLSRRELQVLKLAAEGHNGPRIGELLFVSPATVKTHFENIYEKLGVSDRTAAVAYALRIGLLR